ncbi:beta-1,3-galactosyltransferase 5-like [Rana temporaria]|uniref:beta-1,3-galactosyltransferase 5-like n=1 Tax=Rana temporaria TaxID=8407 RepID=UPI001AAD2167|nr:beta-1,3-galactosyltransferase 5-like [Rana temporaria]XP_040194929.1 beta-1,3-galactosyltransferase 5-like [Rana temporaria]
MAPKKMIIAAFVILPCLSMLSYIIYIDTFKRNPSIKLHGDTCKQNPPFLVLLVTTTHDQKTVRMAIRKTWGQEQLILGKRVVTFFLLGTNPTPSTEKDAFLSEEIDTYKDIIQKDFMDTYDNLTYKTLMGMEWITNHCPQTHYVMKTDVDMFINTFYLVQLLMRKKQTSNLFTGFLKPTDAPIRDKNSKWYVSESEFSGDKYPPFCSGTGYVLSVDVAQRIYNISFSVPFLKLEDVYIGMCLEKLNIGLQELHDKPVFFPSKPPFSVCTYRNLVTSHRVEPHEMILYWDTLEKAQDEKC